MKLKTSLLGIISFFCFEAHAGKIFYVVPNYNGGTNVTCKVRTCSWSNSTDTSPSCSETTVTAGTGNTIDTSTVTQFKVATGWCIITPTSGTFAQNNATGTVCYSGQTQGYAAFMVGMPNCNGGPFTWNNISGTTSATKNSGISFMVNGGRPF